MFAYYDRSLAEITVEQCQKLWSDSDYRAVKRERVGKKYCVVTLWRGWDPYRLMTETGPTNIFETVVFRRVRSNEEDRGIDLFGDDIYWEEDDKIFVPDAPTEIEALTGHARAVQAIKSIRPLS
jgi:hypothetical protein